jgi:hypothetical protein
MDENPARKMTPTMVLWAVGPDNKASLSATGFEDNFFDSFSSVTDLTLKT